MREFAHNDAMSAIDHIADCSYVQPIPLGELSQSTTLACTLTLTLTLNLTLTLTHNLTPLSD